MPAKSPSQQRLFGMVTAYKRGKLKHAPKKIRQVAEHISDEDAEHFARTKHSDMKKASFDFRRMMDGLDKLASGTKVVVYDTDGSESEFQSMAEAAGFLASKGSVPVSKVKEMLSQRVELINGLRVEYPDVLPSESKDQSGSGVEDLASFFRGMTGSYGASSYGI